MADQISVERLEADYPPNGFPTQLGRVTPFYGRDASYVVVGGRHWLSAEEARNAAAALLTVAADLGERVTDRSRRNTTGEDD
jgi:hypothetical protein